VADDKKTQIGTGPIAVAAPALTPQPLAEPAKQTSYLPPTGDPMIGKTLAGRYVIERKLGEGGMGAVYLATHTLLEKQVALKVLHGEFVRKPDLVERFIQEAKAASRIRHENVIDISDFGKTDDGYVFFAMELLHGHDLHDEVTRARLAGQLLPWQRSKKIFLQICAALAAAHARGIVHRDLKPENVYLVEFLGEPDFVKLLDFGIAKMTEVPEGERKLTRTGMLFGTPEYMSPEQARGEHADHRVDVYAMGCILFQLVSGRVPFESDNFMGVLSLHLTEAPPNIPAGVFDRIGAPRALAAIIERALAKDKQARFQTIDEMANAIRVASGDAPVSAQQPVARAASVPAPATTVERPAVSTTGRQRTQWTGNLAVPTEEPEAPRRSKLPLAIGAVAVVAAGAVAGVYAMRGRDTPTTHATMDSGSPPPAVYTPDAAPVVVATPDAAPAPPVPVKKVTLKIDSTPAGADVIDAVTKRNYGKTPIALQVDQSGDARAFVVRRTGFADATFDMKQDHDGDHLAKLEKQHTGSAGGTGSAGSNVTHPDPGSAAPHPHDDDCPDDKWPCLKTNIPGLHGSGSGP
jgi:serine/threonine-protein kinase